MTPTKSRGIHPDAYARLEAENATLRQQVQTLREALEHITRECSAEEMICHCGTLAACPRCEIAFVAEKALSATAPEGERT